MWSGKFNCNVLRAGPANPGGRVCGVASLIVTSCVLVQPVLVAVRSKGQVCGRLITGIAVSNPAGGMGVRLLCLLCFV